MVYDEVKHGICAPENNSIFNYLFEGSSNNQKPRSESDILCATCSHNQNIIVQYMRDFEPDSKTVKQPILFLNIEFSLSL